MYINLRNAQCEVNSVYVHVCYVQSSDWNNLWIVGTKLRSELCAGNPRIVRVLAYTLLILYTCTFISLCMLIGEWGIVRRSRTGQKKLSYPERR